MNIYRFSGALLALFAAQILRSYLASFREGAVRHKTCCCIVWGFYLLLQYLVTTSGFGHHPLLFVLSDILLITLIQIFSGSSLRTALFHSAIFDALCMTAAFITYGILSAAGTVGDYFSAAGNLITKIAVYITIQIYRRLQTQDPDMPLSFPHRFELVFLPALSLLIIYITYLVTLRKWTNGLFSLISVLIILVNYLIFETCEKPWPQALLERQNRSYEQEIRLCVRQAAEREEAYQQTRTLRHDLKGRLIALNALLDAGQIEHAKTTITQMLAENSLNRHRTAESGNLALDALINYKYAAAASDNIQMECLLEVPAELFADGSDLCVILENLLDNATEAVQKLPENMARKICLTVRLTKGALLIAVENPYAGKITVDSRGNILSAKTGDHGIGLLSVKRTAAKYNGEVSLRHEDGVFLASVMLFQQEI